MRDRSNRWFTAAVVGGGAAMGSVITGLFVGGILWGLVFLATGRLAIQASRPVFLIACAFAFYFLGAALSALVNDRSWNGATAILDDLPFLAFLLVFSRLAFSSREAIARAVEIGVIVGALAACGLALYQFLAIDAARVSGMAGNPGPFALVCAVLYGLAILSAIRRRGLWRVLSGLAACAAAAAIALSGMRSLWPVLLLAPFIPLLSGMVGQSRRNLLSYGATVVVLLVVVMIPLQSAFEQRVRALVSDIAQLEKGVFDTSIGQRLTMWSAGIDLARERPIFGYGPGSVPDLLQAATAGDEVQTRFSHFHNFVLTAQIEAGLIGVVSVLAVLAVPLAMGWSGRGRDATASFGFAVMLVIVTAYVCSGLLNIMLGHDILDTLFIYGMIVTSYLVFGEPLSSGTRSAGASDAAILMALHPLEVR